MGVEWYHWKDNWSPIEKAVMKVRKPHSQDNKNVDV